MGSVISNSFRYLVLTVGGILGFIELYFLKGVSHLEILLPLILLIWVCEHFYIPTDFYKASMVLPILFFIGLNWSSSVAVLTILLVSVLDLLVFKKRRMYATFYACSLIIAVTGATQLTDWVMSVMNTNDNDMLMIWVKGFVFSMCFFLIKYGLNFGMFFNQKFNAKILVTQQIVWSLIVFICSFIYCVVTLIFEQDLAYGMIHQAFYFFFFTPLVTASLLASFISRLQKEQSRLANVYTLTTLVNSGITSPDPIQDLVVEMRKVFSIDASTLWLNENGQWEIFHRHGLIKSDLIITDNLKHYFMRNDRVIAANREEVAEEVFQKKIQTVIYAPLKVEGDLIGIWAVGSTFKHAYSKSDFQSFVMLANQVAAIAKTRRLVRKQETHKILEERNRIAREIHDGIGQTIAGAVMDLESVDKSFYLNATQSHALVQSSIGNLRASLSQVRASIYALRPNPIEQSGLVEAVRNVIFNYEEENPDVHIRFVVKGETRLMGVFVEKGILDIFREGLRNIEKHAEATKITIFIGYFKEMFCMFLKDNGKGFSLGTTLFRARANKSFGMLNMNELSEQLGAELNIQSREGLGTKISLTIPYQTEREDENIG